MEELIMLSEFFYLNLQLRDTQSAIRNKLKDLFSELKGFKCVTTSVLKINKIASDDETKNKIDV